MKSQEELAQRVIDAVTRFERDQMSITPADVSVDLHPGSLVVTFRGATSPAERDRARDVQARERLERFHREVFDQVKPALETAIQDILGRTVVRSSYNLDVASGDGVILFSLAEQR